MPVNKPRRRGSYAPLSAHYYKDDKLIRAGEKAEILYVRALAFCADVLNDGVITDAQLLHVGVGLSNVRGRAKNLCDTGAWRRVDGGYEVVAWLGWNKSRDAILADTVKDRDRKSPQQLDLPLPPEPDPDGHPDRDPWDHAESDRIPNGNQSESERSPSGFQPSRTRARGPARGGARAPSRARADAEPEPGQNKSSSARVDTDGTDPADHHAAAAALVDSTLPASISGSPRRQLATRAARRLAAGAPPDAVTAALHRWATTSRVTTAALDFMVDDAIKDTHRPANPAARTGTDAKVAGWHAIRDELAAREHTTAHVIQLPGSNP